MKTRYLVIGSGKMAKHFSHYLKLKNLELLSWSRKTNSAEDLDQFKKQATHALISISDSEIQNFIQTNLSDFSGPIIHFSGALNIPEASSLHPLMTFTEHLYPLETYEDMHFVNFTDKEFSDFFPGLKNQSSKLNPSAKAFYHSLCVLGGNFAQILWSKMLSEFQALGLPPQAGMTYIQQIFLNFMAEGKKAVTGPLVRGDQKTIQNNLEALQQDPYQKVYQSFVDAYSKESIL